jgi:hypothetical protein
MAELLRIALAEVLVPFVIVDRKGHQQLARFRLMIACGFLVESKAGIQHIA